MSGNQHVHLRDFPGVEQHPLAVGAKSEFYNMICEFAKEGLAVILISSELPEVIGLSDRIIVMRGRRIVGEISAKDATEEKLLSMAMMEET